MRDHVLTRHGREEHNLGEKKFIALSDQYNRLGNGTEILLRHFKCNLYSLE